MAKCSCGSPECKIGAALDSGSHTLEVYGPNGELILMYLDANAVVELIQELRKFLLDMTEEL